MSRYHPVKQDFVILQKLRSDRSQICVYSGHDFIRVPKLICKSLDLWKNAIVILRFIVDYVNSDKRYLYKKTN